MEGTHEGEDILEGTHEGEDILEGTHEGEDIFEGTHEGEDILEGTHDREDILRHDTVQHAFWYEWCATLGRIGGYILCYKCFEYTVVSVSSLVQIAAYVLVMCVVRWWRLSMRGRRAHWLVLEVVEVVGITAYFLLACLLAFEGPHVINAVLAWAEEYISNFI
jgi:hypothetical protein